MKAITIEESRALTVAINSLRFNPDLCDIEVQSYEIALANMRDGIQEGEKNDPLTLEELKELNGEPVWREQPGYDGRWVLVDCFWSREGVIYLRNIGGSSELAETAFKEGVKVYRRRRQRLKKFQALRGDLDT